MLKESSKCHMKTEISNLASFLKAEIIANQNWKVNN